MYASSICREFYKWIGNKEPYGEIHSVFKNTINILSEDGKLISVIVNDKPMSPFSIKLEKKFDFENFNIDMGEKGVFRKDSFSSKNINIFYDQAILWDNRVDLISNKDSFENFKLKLNLIRNFILKKGNKHGIFSLMKYIQGSLFDPIHSDMDDKSQLFIKERFIKFIDSFLNYDIRSINTTTKNIIGFGPGLTPSMDDFISGMMIANIYISHFLELDIGDAYKINALIVKDIDNKTTLVSEKMLISSSIGQASEDIRSLMIALTGASSVEELNYLLERVNEFGHTSGTDILCGIYIGSHILAYTC